MRALNIIKERALNMSFDIRSNFGFEQEVIMVGDAKSCMARIASESGIDSKQELCYEELIEIRECFSSSLAQFLFITDSYNIGDNFTKYFPATSDKAKLLTNVLETGTYTAPLSAFLGRIPKGGTKSTKISTTCTT